jgi:ribosome-associated protein
MVKSADITSEALKDLVIEALEDRKALNICTLDVRDRTSITDIMVIASGTSTRQVKALAGNVLDKAAAQGYKPIGVEGEDYGEWILVDLGDVVVHIMLPEIREFYGLEKLWKVDAEQSPATGAVDAS